MIADGGEAISDIATLADQPGSVRVGGLGFDVLAGAGLGRRARSLAAMAAARAGARRWSGRNAPRQSRAGAAGLAGGRRPLLDAQGRTGACQVVCVRRLVIG